MKKSKRGSAKKKTSKSKSKRKEKSRDSSSKKSSSRREAASPLPPKTKIPKWISQLAGGLVHEMKNPLSIINMNLQLLQESMAEPQNNKEQRILKKLNVLMEEISRLDNILNDFLRFSRSQTLNRTECSLNDVLEEVLEFVDPEALQNQVKILKHFDESIPPVEIDRNLMKQALLNLVLNALQAMQKGGELIIKTERNGSDVYLDVIDTGPGIPADKLEKIWDLYYSSKQTGTGLGLPTTKNIIKAHNGEIWVESEENKGSKFTIKLPLEKSENEQQNGG